MQARWVPVASLSQRAAHGARGRGSVRAVGSHFLKENHFMSLSLDTHVVRPWYKCPSEVASRGGAAFPLSVSLCFHCAVSWLWVSSHRGPVGHTVAPRSRMIQNNRDRVSSGSLGSPGRRGRRHCARSSFYCRRLLH